jgi:predicted acylesterase/phospholipase RssA
MSEEDTDKKKREKRPLWLVSIARVVDTRTRYFDLWLNRSDQRRILPGHSWSLALLSLLALMAVTNGPILLRWRGPVTWMAVGLALVGVVVSARFAIRLQGQPVISDLFGKQTPWLPVIPWGLLVIWLAISLAGWSFPFFREIGFSLVFLGIIAGLLGTATQPGGGAAIQEWTVFLLAAAAVWWAAADDATQARTGAPYRHAIAPVGVLIMFFALPFARWWSRVVFASRFGEFREAFQPLLHKTELFDPGFPSAAKWNEILRAYFLAVVNTPFQLLLIPAAAILIAPPSAIIWYGGIALLFSWMLMAMVVFHPRLNSLLGIINRLFVEGASLLVSSLIVIIAVARILNVGYVTTVLDGATSPVILQYLLMLYSLSWIYDYWSSRALIDVLLGILDPEQKAPVEVAYYHPSADFPGCRQWLQVHGGSRIAAMRETGDPRTPYHFNIFRPIDVFHEIAQRSKTSSNARQQFPVLAAQIRFFRTFPALLFFGTLIWCSWQFLSTTRLPHIEASPAPMVSDRSFSLPAGIAAVQQQDSPDGTKVGRPVYFVAASGGGTRAALYTMTVLEALERQDALHRVLGISSVSGGSLATAFFAGRRPDLLSPDESVSKQAWNDFVTTVTDEHIRHVLAGAFEWRLVRGERFGTILKESFAGHFTGTRRTIGDCSDLAVILNTALVGEAPTRDAPSSNTSTDDSGSRVVFTNVATFQQNTAADADPGYASDLRFVTFGDPSVTLAAAASASANFPPVFSNIAIDRREGSAITARYWVTDGGAMDNRGLISLLVALRSMLQDWDRADGVLPPIRILVVDASSYSNDFNQDRGLSALGGARLNVSSKLIAVLLRQVQTLHRQKSDSKTQLTIHDLTLPRAIRSGMGTHWMMPTETTFGPRKWVPGTTDETTATLTEDQILPLFRQIYADDRSWPDGFQEEWIREDDPRPVMQAILRADDLQLNRQP